MKKNIRYYYSLLQERLWFKPLLFCIISVGSAFLAHIADNSFLDDMVPEIEEDSIEVLLNTISASMLVIAIFAVGSMLSAFSAASSSATPRSFPLIVSDDVSQNALSIFIGSFIYSIIATVAFKNDYFGKAGNFTLFILTLIVFAIVILTFLRWVDSISKLGRMGQTIQKVEKATKDSFLERKQRPYLGAKPLKSSKKGTPVFSKFIGHITHIHMDQVNEFTKEFDVDVIINCLPGSFCTPDQPLAYFQQKHKEEVESEKLINCFEIGSERSFLDDPRFGLIALSEIGSRALSPGINDPGTAIAIIKSHTRLFCEWFSKEDQESKSVIYDRIEVPPLSLSDMFEDAFRPIARDGAGTVEVMIWLQKSFSTLWNIGNQEAQELAILHSKTAFERAEKAISNQHDIERLKEKSLFFAHQKS
ncbi:MAG TPA: DUF2254 domain-containing protein [Algoriphagus sp.]|jgi:uncharacterized membrane protein|uniref:DUF2254 domain-containing protein n=1 Tax=unclassified Algoriphagus TaxID=2641541 RepID=UPI000C4B0100|nr:MULTISPECIES: DUF2254 domain-containing protein [unclassified Algoriphagus]MAL12190.1 hypothetical protein [Algoriphagus sp.]MAN86965.1 hypothetical protein [Algoriphagus sp.]QYH40419.1 DUF2254 domain-containing protein [Algoriphagus sp. NBT04N3]HAD52446.1 DUF2254 domain-containing protein [Algoriphagus sp.]HAS59595.1 DUF2254 domain-containing protein [Algoriphagus sp.]